MFGETDSKDEMKLCSNVAKISALGKVDYVFSDKTGTITKKELKFRSMVVGTESYGKINYSS